MVFGLVVVIIPAIGNYVVVVVEVSNFLHQI